MELRHLRYFITVAEELSFSKAALKLHTAQPSLSQQIKDLEDEVGVQLLHRTKRKVELTDEGLVFLEQARLTLTQADKAVTMARQVAAAKVLCLRIGFVPSAEIRIFPYILPRLRVRLPKLQIRSLNLKESDQIAKLKKGDLDIIFINQKFENETFASQLVLKEPLVLMLPKQHPLAQCSEITTAQLQGLILTILTDKLSQPLAKTITQYIKQQQIHFQNIDEANTIGEAIQAVRSGQSCAILPAYIQALATDQIVVRPLEYALPYLDVFMSYPKHESSTATQHLIDEIQTVFGLEKPFASKQSHIT
ncbi:MULTISPECIES: DNA-binding transcriptional regulator HcaR [unclassified Acinetobacter]|uniref:DNA-binding transcriptional regulator HcaR n=1 Tax=unclassified Acinetobacter TaxID=196816 RepID=UPI001F4B4969|nr:MULTISPECIES: DNA-binding transcriptional regulator HcaR [unclassified Acinetobacter]MCH7351008.1 DNA-binding transcriptional regulator HcaR [Acinetobacter sp. NIPH 2023]MCH7358619.1 DNA-binding transcriptional regulator HcaR [Acinetobacter sp. NIPH 2024]